MSSKLNDIADLYIVEANTQPSSAVVTSVTGATIDFVTCDNNCFAIQVIGTVGGTAPTFIGKIQEAITATGTYADVSGAVFPTITSTTGANIIQTINFQRTLQYLRYIGTISGTTSSVALDVLILGQKKQVS
jgi:hypothetical protein